LHAFIVFVHGVSADALVATNAACVKFLVSAPHDDHDGAFGDAKIDLDSPCISFCSPFSPNADLEMDDGIFGGAAIDFIAACPFIGLVLSPHEDQDGKFEDATME
jgi:hypothetical protein